MEIARGTPQAGEQESNELRPDDEMEIMYESISEKNKPKAPRASESDDDMEVVFESIGSKNEVIYRRMLRKSF